MNCRKTEYAYLKNISEKWIIVKRDENLLLSAGLRHFGVKLIRPTNYTHHMINFFFFFTHDDSAMFLLDVYYIYFTIKTIL